MKFLKSFENNNLRYKIGDYVKIFNKNLDEYIYAIVAITQSSLRPYFMINITDDTKEPKLPLSIDVIPLSSEELLFNKDIIKKYEIGLTSNKYNI